MKLLIPGGAGYVGSHLVRYAQEHGHEVVVLDDFSTGHKWSIKDCEILEVNLLDAATLSKLLKGRFFDGVIHFAAKSLVNESVTQPELYYRNNIIGTLNLLREMKKNNITDLVFSSTASIFGNPISEKVAEDHPKNPLSPYGRTKLMVENILEDVCEVDDFNVTCLRYFNAAGAHESGLIGEMHEPETHLIPNVLNSALMDKKVLKIFGDDYPTIDGTCVRDYVHVSDLAQAHLLALQREKKTQGFSAFNLGNGFGFSVLEIIRSAQDITGLDVDYDVLERREGDAAVLVADNRHAINALGWKPKWTKISDIIKSAWLWHSR